MSERIERLLAELTLEEKVSMLSGADMWRSQPVERLGIPEMKMTDGPNGARGDAISGKSAVCTPVGIAMASTWNTDLLEEVGTMLGEEARSKAAEVLLGPTINIHRTPLGGRNFECYSEDPALTSKMAIAFTKGVQSQNIAVCLKHFICNDSEVERHTMSSDVDERSLREIYLAPFEAGVKEANAWSVMSSYNKVNGTYAASHKELLTDVLKDEWGFDGYVVSDWGGSLETTGNAIGGLDMEMPGPARTWGKKLIEAVGNGEVPETTIDDKVRRILRTMERTGRLDNPDADRAEQAIDKPEHQALTRRTAQESMVLLRNDGTLPFNREELKSIAVIGPNAQVGQIQGGGSSGVRPHYQVHPLDGITKGAGSGTDIIYERGCYTHKYLPEIDRSEVRAPNFNAPGYKLEVFDGGEFKGAAKQTRLLKGSKVPFFGAFANVSRSGEFCARMSGTLTAKESGTHEFGVVSAGLARLFINDEEVVDNWTEQTKGDAFYGNGSTEKRGSVALEVGKEYEIRVEYKKEETTVFPAMQFGMLPPVPDDLIDRAAEAAANADAAVLVIGTNSDWETEGNDRADMSLPGKQLELINAVLKANPKTAIVVNAGSPIDMPWLDKAPAVLYSWFGGQEYGNAIADILFGDVSPSGKTTCTFPKRLEDTPAFTSYPGENSHVHYGENLFVGYRWYDKRKIEPLVPFGHGLSYASFDYSGLQLPSKIGKGDDATISFDLKNTSGTKAQEIAQVYVRDVESRLVRPVKELKSFAKVELEPGETKRVTVTLKERDLSYWDPAFGTFVAEPGEFEIIIGASAVDRRLMGTLVLEG